jgi:tripartite ATP-independent transporter DctM subunit
MSKNDLIGLGGIAVLLLLMALRMPIGTAMLLVGIVGFAMLNGIDNALYSLGTYPYAYAGVYDFAVIPLFVLMGNLGTVSGMASALYAAAYSWFGHWRGGLAHATIVACAGFAAVCGSSVASAVTMGKVCLPEMRRYKYSHRLATGTIAAGGTLGILIPPSTAFVIYGLLTEQSIGRLLLAGILPGILLTVIFMTTVAIWMHFQPQHGPAGPRASWTERRQSIGRATPMLTIVFVSIGGIYAGIFTPSEAAAVGAFLAFLYALWRRSLTRETLIEILLDTVRTTSLVFLILIGALVFGPFLALSGLPEHIATFFAGLDVPRVVVRLHRARDLPRRLLDAGADAPHRDPDHGSAQLRPDLVRRCHGNRAGNGSDRPAGRHQCLHREGPRSRCADYGNLQRRAAVLDRDGRLHRDPDHVPANRDIHTRQYDQLTRHPEFFNGADDRLRELSGTGLSKHGTVPLLVDIGSARPGRRRQVQSAIEPHA